MKLKLVEKVRMVKRSKFMKIVDYKMEPKLRLDKV